MAQVTDPVLLKELARQGIDPNQVDFDQDYAPRSLGERHSPFAKFYTTQSGHAKGRQFMVVSGLPMVDADGVKIEVGWRVAGVNYFSEKNNLFRAKVQDTQIEITIRNDQPDGRKAGDRLSYKSQLFLDGIEQSCGQSTLLPIDPVNPNYLENTLEWDYGICKRRLRIIEGGILGSWIFASKPNGEVRIKYNQTGDYKLRLGRFKINNDEEVIPKDAFDNPQKYFIPPEYPLTISDSATYNPDAHVESTSVDGYTWGAIAQETWAVLVAAAGTSFGDTGTSIFIWISSGSTANKWTDLVRSPSLFDTSGLPDNAVISAATYSLYGETNYQPQYFNLDMNVYACTPASNTGLQNSDFNTANWGSTAFSTTINQANWKITSPFWNDFALNASGLAAISKTGITKIGIRDATHDAGATAPTWANYVAAYLSAYSSDKGNGYKPKLVVTYTAGTNWTKSLSDSIVISDSISKNTGMAKADTISLSDSFSRIAQFSKSLSDTISLVDTPSKGLSLSKSDTLVMSDALTKTLGLTKADTISLVDAFSRIVTYNKTLTDTISLSDAIAKTFGLSKSDAIIISDNIAKSVGLFKSDNLTLTDTIQFTRSLILLLNSILASDLQIASILGTGLEITSAKTTDLQIASILEAH